MANNKRPLLIAALLIMACLAAGCLNLGQGTQRPTRLYVLTPLAPEAPRAAFDPGKRVTIGVGPLEFPAYLNRPQIVTRTGPSEIKTAPFANWAEPLKENVMGVLLDNIAALTGSDAVYRYPWRVGQAPQVQLQLAIDRFDAERGGEAVLVVRWEWLDQKGEPLMHRERSVLRRPVADGSDDAVVAILSRLLGDYSRKAVERLNRILT